MSTEFGIVRKGIAFTDEVNHSRDFSDVSSEDYITCAYRSNDGTVYWADSFELLVPYLSETIPVFAIDNSCQGIFCIGDINRKIKAQNNAR